MSTTNIFISCGPTRYPEGGGLAAAPGAGVNLLDLVLYKGAKAKEINLTASGRIAVIINSEEIKPYLVNGDTMKFSYKGEGQAVGGKRYGTIKSLEVIGDGQFNMIVTN